MEQHYAFIKNNVVQQIAVFTFEDKELADHIVLEKEFDTAIWVGGNKPHLFATYDPTTGEFTNPTYEFHAQSAAEKVDADLAQLNTTELNATK